MVALFQSAGVLNALGTLIVGAQNMATQAQIDAMNAGPLAAGGAKVGFVQPGLPAGGNGSVLKPYASLEEAAAGLGALAVDAKDGDPVTLFLGPGTYVAPSKPFTRPVSLVLGQGARFAATSTTILATLPARTAATVLTTAWGIQRAPDAVGNAALPTDPAEVGLPVFSFTVGTPSLYLGSTVTYRAPGPVLSFDQGILRAAAVIPSGWSSTFDNVNAAAGVTATGATVYGKSSTLGGVGAVAADALTVTGGAVAGAVTVTTSAKVVDADTTAVTAWTGPITTDTEGWRGLQNASVTPTGAKAFVAGTVVSGRVATSGSPQTITLPGTFPVAPQVVISTEAGDATTFAVVTSTTTTTAVVTYGGTAPVAFRYMAQG